MNVCINSLLKIKLKAGRKHRTPNFGYLADKLLFSSCELL